jgi:hypothetical protein
LENRLSFMLSLLILGIIILSVSIILIPDEDMAAKGASKNFEVPAAALVTRQYIIAIPQEKYVRPSGFRVDSELSTREIINEKICHNNDDIKSKNMHRNVCFSKADGNSCTGDYASHGVGFRD